MNSRKIHSVSVVTGAGLQRQQRRATEGTSVRCVTGRVGRVQVEVCLKRLGHLEFKGLSSVVPIY